MRASDCPSEQAGESQGQPSDATGQSEGSHANGTCKPCIFWASSRGCAKQSCDYCHLAHAAPGEGGRPRRAKRDAIKARIFEFFLVEDEDERTRLLQEEAASHRYARHYIQGFLENPPFDVRKVAQDFIVSI
ncbi:unnamed protein product [Durusdinium trenchii]|uniref:C3H1-type domain-containing protein n=1 Tax=Durusdinium trenchii TaxID=1381693 RepID=A0ABP0JC41_9DINO